MNTKNITIGLLALLALSFAPSGGAQSVLSHADHYQVCQDNDPDSNSSTAPTDELCAFGGVDWSTIILILGDGAFISENTGITWIAMSISAQIIVDGNKIIGDNGEPTAYPGSGPTLEFINGDEDFPDGCPDVAPCTPTYASSGAANDCIVRTTDSNSTVTELNSNVATDTEDVTGTYALYDLFGNPPITGSLELTENFVPANQQTESWGSGTIAIIIPSLVSEVVIEVAFKNTSACDAKDAPVGTATIGADHAVRWDGEVSDSVVFA